MSLKYQIVTDRDKNMLAYLVSKEIKDGWRPQGGVAYNWQDGKLMQALVKGEK